MTEPKNQLPSAPSPAGETASDICADCDHAKDECRCEDWIAEDDAAATLGTCADFPTTPHPKGTCESCDMWTPVAAPIAPAAVSGLTYDDCSLADAQVAEQWAVAYVCKVGVSRETMIDAISTLRALVVTYERAKPSAEGDGWIAPEEWVTHKGIQTLVSRYQHSPTLMAALGELQEWRKLRAKLPAPPSGQGEKR